MYAIACPNYAPNALDAQDEMKSTDTFSLKDLIGDGILWAVPKHRKPIERRLKAKFGHPTYHMKTIPVKTTLRVCMQCGHDHEVGILCRKYRCRNFGFEKHKFHPSCVHMQKPVVINCWAIKIADKFKCAFVSLLSQPIATNALWAKRGRCKRKLLKNLA